MSFSILEQKAIGWFAENNNAIPQLSVRPDIRFMVRGTGEILTQHIVQMTANYKAARADEAKERARKKKMERNR